VLQCAKTLWFFHAFRAARLCSSLTPAAPAISLRSTAHTRTRYPAPYTCAPPLPAFQLQCSGAPPALPAPYAGLAARGCRTTPTPYGTRWQSAPASFHLHHMARVYRQHGYLAATHTLHLPRAQFGIHTPAFVRLFTILQHTPPPCLVRAGHFQLGPIFCVWCAGT